MASNPALRGARTRERLLDVAQELILSHGFAGTPVDAIIQGAGVTKGAFFHHFASKGELARTLLERYAAADAEHLEGTMAKAERLTADPLQQLLLFVGLLEEDLREHADPVLGCLFASYAYAAQLFDEPTLELIRTSVVAWRGRLREKLEAAAAEHALRVDVDLEAVADLLWVVFEGAFILARTERRSEHLARQLRQYRSYLEALFT